MPPVCVDLPPPATPPPMEILIAEDNPLSRNVLAATLGKWGYRVTATEDGLQALCCFRQPHAPSLAILDVEMPGLDGTEVCRRIRDCASQPPPYIILLTGRNSKSDVVAGFAAGADDYVTKPFNCDELRARVHVGARIAELQNRLNERRRELETAVEQLRRNAAELAESNAQLTAEIAERRRIEGELREARRFTEAVTDANPNLIYVHDVLEQRIIYANPRMTAAFGFAAGDHALLDRSFLAQAIFHEDHANVAILGRDVSAMRDGDVLESTYRTHGPAGELRWFRSRETILSRTTDGHPHHILGTAEDITERRLLERKLHQAQKLESIGQLAAGVAHEINTPTQYVSDNIHFLDEGFSDLSALLHQHPALLTGDLAFVVAEFPKAIQQAREGVSRISSIVQSMKYFAHPGSKAKTLVDLNRAIQSTLTVSRAEWKYVAEVVTDFDPTLPQVSCLVSDFNQVVLNLILNAAHAIRDAVRGENVKGTISVSTRREGRWAELRIRDTGTGIPEEIRGKIFDPFFTTKPVGTGTGQGLAISHSVIVEKHGGEIFFESEVGRGTCFVVRLPLDASTPPGGPSEHPRPQHLEVTAVETV